MDHFVLLLFSTLLCTNLVAGVSCPAYPAVLNGIVTYNPLSPLPQLSYNVGAIATLSCNLGFIPSGSTTTKCGQNGSWEPVLGSCNPFSEATVNNSEEYCGPVSHEMGTITYLPGHLPPKFHSGALAILSCPPGQAVMGGASQAICQNGKWSTALGFCKHTELKLF